MSWELYNCPDFTDAETEAQTGQVTRPRPHSLVALGSTSPDSRSYPAPPCTQESQRGPKRRSEQALGADRATVTDSSAGVRLPSCPTSYAPRGCHPCSKTEDPPSRLVFAETGPLAASHLCGGGRLGGALNIRQGKEAGRLPRGTHAWAGGRLCGLPASSQGKFGLRCFGLPGGHVIRDSGSPRKEVESGTLGRAQMVMSSSSSS